MTRAALLVGLALVASAWAGTAQAEPVVVEPERDAVCEGIEVWRWAVGARSPCVAVSGTGNASASEGTLWHPYASLSCSLFPGCSEDSRSIPGAAFSGAGNATCEGSCVAVSGTGNATCRGGTACVASSGTGMAAAWDCSGDSVGVGLGMDNVGPGVFVAPCIALAGAGGAHGGGMLCMWVWHHACPPGNQRGPFAISACDTLAAQGRPEACSDGGTLPPAGGG